MVLFSSKKSNRDLNNFFIARIQADDMISRDDKQHVYVFYFENDKFQAARTAPDDSLSAGRRYYYINPVPQEIQFTQKFSHQDYPGKLEIELTLRLQINPFSDKFGMFLYSEKNESFSGEAFCEYIKSDPVFKTSLENIIRNYGIDYLKTNPTLTGVRNQALDLEKGHWGVIKEITIHKVEALPTPYDIQLEEEKKEQAKKIREENEKELQHEQELRAIERQKAIDIAKAEANAELNEIELRQKLQAADEALKEEEVKQAQAQTEAEKEEARLNQVKWEKEIEILQNELENSRVRLDKEREAAIKEIELLKEYHNLELVQKQAQAALAQEKVKQAQAQTEAEKEKVRLNQRKLEEEIKNKEQERERLQVELDYVREKLNSERESANNSAMLSSIKLEKAQLELEKAKLDKEKSELERNTAYLNNQEALTKLNHAEKMAEYNGEFFEKRKQTNELSYQAMLNYWRYGIDPLLQIQKNDEDFKKFAAEYQKKIAYEEEQMTVDYFNLSPDCLVDLVREQKQRHSAMLRKICSKTREVPVSRDPSSNLGKIKTEIVKIGSEITFSFSSELSGYLTIIWIGTSGKIYLIEPNCIDVVVCKIEANQQYFLPGPEFLNNAPITHNGPAGVEQLLVIVSKDSLGELWKDLHLDTLENFAVLGDKKIQDIVKKLNSLNKDSWSAGYLAYRLENNQ